MKKFLIITLATILGTGVLTANAATKMNLNDPTIGISVTENREILTDGPNLLAQTMTKDGERFYLCKTSQDEICLAAQNVKATSYLPPCDTSITINCISSVFAIDENGKKSEGTFTKYVDEGSVREYAADPALNLPQGKGHGGVWTIPGVKNAVGGEEYYVGALLYSWGSVDAANKRYKAAFYPQSLVSGISPVTRKAGAYGTTIPSDSTNKSNDGSPNGGVGSSNTSQPQDWSDCVVTEVGTCFMAEEFPSNYRFGLTIKLGKALKGWFHGRIYRPQISVTQADASTQVITIDAMPVLIPIVKEKVPTASLTPDLRTFLENTEVANGFGYVMPGSSGEQAFKEAKLWLPVIKDKATQSLTYWSVRTLTYYDDPTIEKCTTNNDGLSGVVSTNSLVYNAGPPAFDKSTQNLNYKVLSPHFTSKGEIAKGTYDLILSSKVARCIYGFTTAPIKADLTILSEDGSPQVATQIINEKNGWLTLSAAGFTYSSPTISVMLTQEKAPAPAPEVTTQATPTPQPKKVTIICTKGKVTKKVSGINPKCPTGYKKAA
jgi:hypothetical protein